MKKLNSYFFTIITFSILLYSISIVHARPFGMNTMSHINSAIKQQIRRAFVPVLKSKNEKIEFPKIMAFSKDYNSFAFLTEGAYISVWNLKQGKEYFNFPLADIETSKIAINHSNNDLFIIGQNGKAYRKKIYSEDNIQNYQPISDISKYKDLKTVRYTQVLSSANQLIISPNVPLKKSFTHEFPDSIVDFDITSDAKNIVVATAKKLYLLELKKFKKLKEVKQWELSNEINQVKIDGQTGSIALKFSSSFFANAGYGLIKKLNNYQDIQLFSDSINGFAFTLNKQLGVYTSNQNIYYHNLSTGNIEKTLSIEKFKPELVEFYNNDQFIFLPVRDKGLHLIETKSAEKLAQLVSTKNGWAVLDSRGRFDGNEAAVADISWEANGKMFELDRFSNRYFEPGLLAKVISNNTTTKVNNKKIVRPKKKTMITKAANKLEEGLYLPPVVTLDVKTNQEEYQASNHVSLLVTAKTDKDKKSLQALKSLRFYHNGKRLKNDNIVVSKNQDDSSKTWKLKINPTQGDNTFLAEVAGWGDILGQSKTKKFHAKAKVEAKKKDPVVFIKTIGIDEYKGDELDLNFAVADAKDIYQVISDYQDNVYYKGKVVKLAPSVKTMLLNNKASKKQIFKMLDTIKESATPDDMLFLFMSGHGQVVDNQWYFLPQEAKTLLEPAHVKKVGLSSQELSEKLVKIPNQKIILIVDACQSGAATEDFNNFQQRRDLSGLSKDTGIHIMAATRADQLAPEYAQLGHGIFTYILLNGLKKNKKGFYNADRWPKDGKVMIKELKKYTEKFVPIMISVLEKRREAQLVNRGIANQRTVVTPVGSSIGKDFQLF